MLMKKCFVLFCFKCCMCIQKALLLIKHCISWQILIQWKRKWLIDFHLFAYQSTWLEIFFLLFLVNISDLFQLDFSVQNDLFCISLYHKFPGMLKKKKKKAHLFYYQKHLKCQKCSDISRIKHKYRMRLLLLDATPFNLIGTVLLLITNEKAIHFASYSKCS